MSNETIVDETDYGILFAVKQHDMPPWKNKIHGWIVEHEDMIPIAGGVSVQTVGRRVDDLVNEDYLETVIVSPEDIKRDLIIAFKLTDKGLDTIEGTREHLLAEMVQDHLFTDQGREVQSGTIAMMLADRYNWSGETADSIQERYGARELSSFLTLLYIEEQTDGMIEGMSETILEELAEDADDLRTAQNIDPDTVVT